MENGKATQGADLHIEEYRIRFIEAMDDDLNTADAVGTIFEFIKDCNTFFADVSDAKQAGQALLMLGELLCILGLAKKENEDIPQEVFDLVEQRAAARKEKNWTLADKLRNAIKEKGYEIKMEPMVLKSANYKEKYGRFI